MIRSSALVGLAAALFGLLSVAEATVALPMTLQELTSESTVVVHATVLARESSWDDTKSRIYTFTKLGVMRTLKGSVPNKEITIRQWGGTVGNVVMHVPGNATFKVGEEVVVFLSAEEGLHFVVGLAQGKFRVQAEASGKKVATRDTSEIGFASWDEKGRMQIAPRWELDRPMYLDELEARVKKAAQSR
jgi:hypothetical protein